MPLLGFYIIGYFYVGTLSDFPTGRVSRNALRLLHLRTDGDQRTAQVLRDFRHPRLAAVRALSTLTCSLQAGLWLKFMCSAAI